MAQDTTQKNEVPESISVHVADGDGLWQRDEEVKLGDDPFPRGSTGDPNAHAWDLYDGKAPFKG